MFQKFEMSYGDIHELCVWSRIKQKRKRKKKKGYWDTVVEAHTSGGPSSYIWVE